MKRQLGFTVTELLFAVLAIGLVLAAAWGYVWNIIKLVAIVSDPITGMLVLRAIGVVVLPLGCIVGWL